MARHGICFRYSPSWIESGDRVRRYLSKYYSWRNYNILLNFTENHKNEDPHLLVLNKNVEDMRDKIRMNKLLDELEIPHPKTFYYPFCYYYPEIICTLPDSNDMSVIKRRFSEGSNNITFTTFHNIDTAKLDKNNYIQEFVPFEREYRVVVDFLGVIGIKEKIGDSKIKNSRTCKFELIENKELGMFATRVCRKMSVDFTGLDIGEIDGKYYVIELNSAPALCSEFAEMFAHHLIGIYYR